MNIAEYLKLQSRCQRGEGRIADANNLLAECCGALGRLIAENDLLRGPEETVTSARGGRLFTFMSKDPCRYSLCEVTYANPVRELIAERDQLKAEVESMRKTLVFP